MSPRRLTASGLALAALCPATHALPSVEHTESDAMRAGTGRHAFLSGVAHAIGAGTGLHPKGLAVARAEALADVPADAPWRATCEAIDLDAIIAELGDAAGSPVTFVEADLAHAWDPATDTATTVGAVTHRAYADADGLVGTLDWLVTHADGSVTVLDFKGVRRNAPAREHLQLALYGLQVARTRGLDAVHVALCYLDEEGAHAWDRATLDGWDLDAAASRLRGIHAAVVAARAATWETLPTRVGDHCGDCTCVRVCPAMVTLVRELVAVGAPSPERLALLSDDDAGAAWVRLDALDTALAAARRALRARAEIRGLPLPDGQQLVPVESDRRAVVLEKALPVLRERFGAQADAAIEQSMTAASVTKLARQLAPGKGVQKVVDELWGQLAAVGAVRSSRFVQLRVRKGSQSAAAQGDE